MCLSLPLSQQEGLEMCCYVSLAKRIQFTLPAVALELATSATSSSHLQTTWNFRKTLLTHLGSKPAWCKRSTCTSAREYEGAEQLKHLVGQSPWAQTSSGNGAPASFIAPYPTSGQGVCEKKWLLDKHGTCAVLKPRLSGQRDPSPW